MKKKVAAIFMASIMACSMAACGSSGGSSDSGKTDSKDKSTASSTAENGSGEVEKIIVSFPTWTGAPADTEKVQEAINDITRDKIGVEIELSITDYGSFNQNTTLALSANEEIDVLACVGFPYATGIQQGYLSDLEENDLIQTYGQGIIDAVGQENVDACRVNGVLYGLPSNRDIAQGRGCAAIATEYLDGIGYEANTDDEIVKISLDELNDIYAQLHAVFLRSASPVYERRKAFQKSIFPSVLLFSGLCHRRSQLYYRTAFSRDSAGIASALHSRP